MIFLVFFLFPFSLFSQKIYNNWFFGDSAAITFNTKDGRPVSLNNSMMYAFEGCASISDTNGSLLFYTNGMTVWNRNHKPMPNGFGLKGNRNSTQSALIVKKPGSKSIYYLFTSGICDTRDSVREGINYSIVDMSFDKGLGDVVTKNIPVLKPATEKLTATFHKNGRDFWVICHEFMTNTYHAYLLTKDGLSSQPVKTSIGSVLDTGNSVFYLKISPDMKKIANALDYKNRIELFRFDNSTGIISDLKTVTFPYGSYFHYSIEFSPDSKKLYSVYYFANSCICIMDITSNQEQDIINSQKVIHVMDWMMPSDLLLAPDGNIYFSVVTKNYLGVIKNPNDTGAGCTVNEKEVILSRGICTYGLPNNIAGRLVPEIIISSTSYCEGDNIQLMSEVNLEGDVMQYQWSGPNGFSSAAPNPVLLKATTAMSGRYTLSVTVDDKTAADTVYIDVKPKPLVSITPSKSATICEGEEFIINAECSQSNVSYEWSTGENTRTIKVRNEGIYSVRAINEAGCFSSDTFELKVNPKPVAEIMVNGKDTLCPGNELTLSANKDFAAYSWSSGEKTKEIKVTVPGVYRLTVTDENGCPAEAAKEVYQSTLDVTIPNGIDFGRICSGKLVERDIDINNNSFDKAHIKGISFSNTGLSAFNYSGLIQDIEPKGKTSLKLLFNPYQLGGLENSLIIEFDRPCINTFSIPLKGTSIARAKVYLSDTNVWIGKRFDIPVYAELTCGKSITDMPDYEAEIRLDVSAFNPYTDQFASCRDLGVQNGERVFLISKSGGSLDKSGRTINTLPGEVLLASSEVIPVRITGFKWKSDYIENETQDGMLRIKGVCKPSLSQVKRSGSVNISVHPNPATNKTEIKIVRKKHGRINISVYTMQGVKLDEIEINKDNYELSTTLSLENYSAGLYEILVRTDEETEIVPVVVVK